MSYWSSTLWNRILGRHVRSGSTSIRLTTRCTVTRKGDSGFCRDSLMKWCEDHDVGFVLGLARNQRLVRALGAAMHGAHSVHRRTGKAVRRFRDFTYRTRKSWSRGCWVVGKAEYLSKGENPRFVVTNLGQVHLLFLTKPATARSVCGVNSQPVVEPREPLARRRGQGRRHPAGDREQNGADERGSDPGGQRASSPSRNEGVRMA